MRTIAAIYAALALAACAPDAGDPAAQPQRPAPASEANAITVAGFSGILGRSAILFERSDKSLTQCFFAEGQLSHCANMPDPQAIVAGYTALGSTRTLRDGDDAALLLQRSDGSLRQCLFVEGAMSACTDGPVVSGRIVGYHYFRDASAILYESANGGFTHCWIERERLSNCFSHSTAPGRIVGLTETGEDEASILFARTDGALAECLLSADRLHECATFTPPFPEVVGYNWRHPSAAVLFAREDGALVRCFLVGGAVSNCADVPSPP